MENTEIYKKLSAIFRKTFEDQTIEVKEDTSASDIQKWDSLNHIILISEIEKEFGLKFSLDDVIGFETAGDIVKSIDQKSF